MRLIDIRVETFQGADRIGAATSLVDAPARLEDEARKLLQGHVEMAQGNKSKLPLRVKYCIKDTLRGRKAVERVVTPDNWEEQTRHACEALCLFMGTRPPTDSPLRQVLRKIEGLSEHREAFGAAANLLKSAGVIQDATIVPAGAKATPPSTTTLGNILNNESLMRSIGPMALQVAESMAAAAAKKV